MEIHLDETAVSEAVRAVAAEAITAGIGSWEMRQAVRLAAEKAIENLGLLALMTEAITAIVRDQAPAMVAEAARAAAPAISMAVQHAVIEQSVGVLYALRHRGGYQDDASRTVVMNEIRATLTGAMAVTNAGGR